MPQRKTVQVRKAAPKKKVVTVTRAKAPKVPRAVGTAGYASYKTKSGSKNGLFGSAGGTVGGMIGTALGGPAGGLLGSTLGRLGGAALSSIFGHGDYETTNAGQLKNNNIVLSNSAQAPQFGSGKVACKFVHREYLGDVYSSATPGAFKIDSYPINPGLSETFPWLSGVVGAKFQQYRINGMAFEFRSMSSDALNSTNTALGSVIMSTDYDSADAVFTSKQEMENTEYGVSCKPSSNMMHGIECARFQTPVSELYIRAFDVPAGKDVRLYDLGRFSIATTGCQGANVNLGELWIAYDIDAFKAIEQPPQYLTPIATYKLNGVDATHALGTSQTAVIDQIGIQFEYKEGVASVIMPYDMPPGSIFSFFWGLSGTTTAGVPTGDVPEISPSLDPLMTGNGWSGYAATPYPITQASDYKSFYTSYKYDGTGTPSNPPKLAVAGGVVPAALVDATLVISMMSSLTPTY